MTTKPVETQLELPFEVETTPAASSSKLASLATERLRDQVTNELASQKPVNNDDLSDEAQGWVELFPSGISFGNGVGRPVLVLKDKHQVEVLPVWMNPLDAAVGLQELSTGSGATPHSVTRRILEALDVNLESCHFVELIGHHQYVALRFQGSDRLKALKVRADEAMSFCLQGKARFFSTKEFMARCRDMEQNLSELEGTFGKGSLAAIQAEREIVSKKHPYVM